MSTATLLPGETCPHCHLVAPDYPTCPGCSKPMEDWPQVPSRFLYDKGWTYRDGWWYEPITDCMGKATPKMVVDAEKRLEVQQEVLQWKSTKRDPQRLESFQEGERNLKALLAKYYAGELVQLREPSFYAMQDAVRRELNKPIRDEGVVDVEQDSLDNTQVKLVRDKMLKTGLYSIQEATELSRPLAHKEQCCYCKQF